MTRRIPRRAGRASAIRPSKLVAFATLTLIVAAPALALDPPASLVNPRTGAIEIADPVWAGAGQDVRYVIDNGTRTPSIETVSDAVADDRSPRLAIAAAGDAWVVWWRDLAIDGVFVRTRDHDTGGWGAVRQVGEANESASKPDVVHDGTRAWVAYEIGGTGARTIAAAIVDDEPDPVGLRAVLGTTNSPGPLDVRVEAASGAVWVSWIYDHHDVGWSVYDTVSESWSLPAYEGYSNDSVEAARDRIRAQLTGN